VLSFSRSAYREVLRIARAALRSGHNILKGAFFNNLTLTSAATALRSLSHAQHVDHSAAILMSLAWSADYRALKVAWQAACDKDRSAVAAEVSVRVIEKGALRIL